MSEALVFHETLDDHKTDDMKRLALAMGMELEEPRDFNAQLDELTGLPVATPWHQKHCDAYLGEWTFRFKACSAQPEGIQAQLSLLGLIARLCRSENPFYREALGAAEKAVAEENTVHALFRELETAGMQRDITRIAIMLNVIEQFACLETLLDAGITICEKVAKDYLYQLTAEELPLVYRRTRGEIQKKVADAMIEKSGFLDLLFGPFQANAQCDMERLIAILPRKFEELLAQIKKISAEEDKEDERETLSHELVFALLFWRSDVLQKIEPALLQDWLRRAMELRLEIESEDAIRTSCVLSLQACVRQLSPFRGVAVAERLLQNVEAHLALLQS